MGGLDRLAEIDRELDSFGKDEEGLADVVSRAREIVPGGLDANDLEAVDAALEGLAEGLSSLPEIARAEAPRTVETQAPPGTSARPASWDERAVLGDLPEDASGIVELPEEVLRREALPPVLSLPQEEPALDLPTGAAPEVETLAVETLAVETLAVETLAVETLAVDALGGDDAAFGASEGSSLELDIAGELADALAETEGAGTGDRSLEALFDDTSLPPPDDLGSGGLADLFESDRPEAEPGAHQSLADLLTPELRAELASDGLASDGLASDGLASDPEEEESTSIFSAADMHAIRASAPPEEASVAASAGASGEFELMIDEEMLELDAEEDEAPVVVAAAKKPTMPPPPPIPSVAPTAGSQPPPDQKGFLSRMLNRK